MEMESWFFLRMCEAWFSCMLNIALSVLYSMFYDLWY